MPEKSGSVDRNHWATARLALGADPLGSAPIDWARLLGVALKQRCAVLAWQRSGPAIRRLAPPAVVSRWRSLAHASIEEAFRRTERVAELLDLLAGAGAEPMVIKGLPLAVTLYGAPSTRPVSDTDLYVPRAHRDAAHAALLTAGWVFLYGRPGGEAVYRHHHPNGADFLELHSTLLDDNLIAHFAGPVPDGRYIDVEGRAMWAHCGPTLPVFLAVHLAKHPHVPVLWWIDFASLWNKSPDDERDAAERLAKSTRLAGFLAWAVSGSALVDTVASGDEAASHAAFAELHKRHMHAPVARVARLSTNVVDSARACLAWALPRDQRGEPLVMARRTWARGLEWSRRQINRYDSAPNLD